jgi:multiple sugar transport system substrate-binding protein
VPEVPDAHGGQRLGSVGSPPSSAPCGSGAAARLLLLAALLAAGCRADPQDDSTLELWGLGREGEILARLVADFERENPGIRVRVQQIPWSAAHEKLLTAYVGGSMPDVFQLGTTWLPEFVALGALERLDPWIAASPVVDPADHFPGVWDATTIEGSVFAIPWYVDTRLLFYRADLLARAGVAAPPGTWEEWRDAMERVRASLGPDHHAILLPLTEWEPPVILALSLGAELLREGDRFGNFRSAAFREAFAFYLDLFRRDLAPRAGAGAAASLYRDFADGRFCFYLTGPWNLGEFARRLPAALQGSWTTAPMPAPDARRPGVSLAGGASLAIVARSSLLQEAWRLVEWLSHPERQIAFYRLSGDLPPRRSAWEAERIASDPRAQAFRAQLEHVRAVPKVAEWERIAALIARTAEAAARGELAADAALEALDADVDAVLEKRRWLLERRAAARP